MSDEENRVHCRKMLGDIPLKTAMIYWNNEDESLGEKGAVMVIPWPDRKGYGSFLNLTMSYGACWAWWRDCSDEQRLEEIFKLAGRMIKRDNVERSDVHEALMVIPEYRACDKKLL